MVQPPKPAPSTVVARPVRKAPPATIQDIRKFPEIIQVQEVILEETAEEESSTAPSEDKGWVNRIVACGKMHELCSYVSFDSGLCVELCVVVGAGCWSADLLSLH